LLGGLVLKQTAIFTYSWQFISVLPTILGNAAEKLLLILNYSSHRNAIVTRKDEDHKLATVKCSHREFRVDTLRGLLPEFRSKVRN